MSYLDTTHELYKEAALAPQASLCCVTSQARFLPELSIPEIMHEMNYGCGTTVHFGDLNPKETILYVGVGGGLEALQFAYFTRRPNSVIAVDRVPEMMAKAQENFKLAADLNNWFQPDFIKVVQGDALNLPVENESVDVAAQNCLFNIFKENDLTKALAEMYRVLKPGGRLYISDPITTKPIPEHLRKDERLRAMCLSGALSFEDYLDKIISVGFGTIEIRARRPYRILDVKRYGVSEDILLESLELVAYKNPIQSDGACVFAGETVIYFGQEDNFDDGKGHFVQRDVPLPICQKTAKNLRALNRKDLLITEPTYHYTGGGCC
ncbi:2-methoxy-6-polyprenyl-1,4-benzoquinol methylase, mitochondrial [Sporomusa silvacetica DSM 10669]|uniref:2-methoxy-6-polyprenyl-1,4-benzoquinol methylase, mitochondrial n=1 Tax=Sporomusa silvacetica DSM 10669 TaxID=1123289 RepID=A0ABZ3IPN0_9FIRM|nr:arsenosugar biosynthesis arsenite methyltransferase ArsM [Sporomusa silvacetica]OZC15877.1 putative methyltransferase YcgJ [Sporomusa silvacetica DSM 10669]